MAGAEAPLPYGHITPPLQRDPAAMVETVYAHPPGHAGGVGRADTWSTDQLASYAVERMYGVDDPVTTRYRRGGSADAPVWHRDGWIISPKVALGATVVLTAIANFGLLDGIKIDNKPIGRIIPDVIGKLITVGQADIDALAQLPVAPTITVNQAPGTTNPGLPKPQNFRVIIPGKEQPSGVAESDTLTVKQLVGQVEAAQKHKQRVDTVTITGEASDEWLGIGESSLGVPNSENHSLATDRANIVARAVRKLLHRDHVKGVTVSTLAVERVQDATSLGNLLVTVNESGYKSISDAIAAYNSGATLPSSLEPLVKEEIARNRTDKATLQFSNQPAAPGESTIPGAAIDSHVGKHHKPFKLPVEFLFVPMIPFFRRSMRNLFNIPPKVVNKVPEKVWIELYKEAKTGIKNELVDDSWALTRKYQLLLRDERIQHMERFDYKDAKGKDRTFRVGFVDHVPTDETRAVVEEIMKKISFMRGGRVAERLNTVMVFPSKNTGQQHPKKIGLGIDEQYSRNVLGVAIPTISLVELQMPTNPTQEQLKDFKGMSWTLAHEVAGHFTDVLDRRPTIKRVFGGQRKRKNYEASNSWAHVGEDGYAKVGRRSTVSVQGRQFAITGRPVDFANGPRTSEVLVSAGDPRLRDAAFVRLQRMGPTEYADTNAAETYAETAANSTTGIPIPFSEAGVEVGDTVSGGYHADSGLLFDFATRVGSQRNREGLAWAITAIKRIESSWRRHDINVNQDEALNRASEFAKGTRFEGPEERLRILAGARD